MIQTIRSKDRYHLDSGWLNTYWHFSFDTYHDPANMNFGPLRVFNDDTFAPGSGFPLHGHREMEIVTYLIDGALEHHDDLGNTGIIRPGEIQRMSAGTGVRHSEFNHSKKDPVHLVQLWITPEVNRLEPSWEQKSFSLADRSGKLLPIAVPASTNGGSPASAVQIHQDASIYTSLLAPGQSATHKLAQGRRAYIFVIGGNLELNGIVLEPGDQARVTGEQELKLSAAPGAAAAPADFLLLDLP
ncbi:MAG: pirin family protein [Acidobacteriia bacterium]|nr:pirin family protein [Terriglobia bacterium]